MFPLEPALNTRMLTVPPKNAPFGIGFWASEATNILPAVSTAMPQSWSGRSPGLPQSWSGRCATLKGFGYMRLGPGSELVNVRLGPGSKSGSGLAWSWV